MVLLIEHLKFNQKNVNIGLHQFFKLENITARDVHHLFAELILRLLCPSSR